MWPNQKQQKRQTYKHTIILNKISKNWNNIRGQVVNPQQQTP